MKPSRSGRHQILRIDIYTPALIGAVESAQLHSVKTCFHEVSSIVAGSDNELVRSARISEAGDGFVRSHGPGRTAA